MKKLLIVIPVVAVSWAWAQTFEGTIKWSMKMVVSPEMKAALAKEQNTDSPSLSDLMPKGFTIKIKNGNTLTTWDNDKAQELYLKDKNQHVSLDGERKIYTINDIEESSADEVTPTIKKTSEMKKILDYNCTKYTVTQKDETGTVTANVWATTEIQGIDISAMASQQNNKAQAMFYKNINGFPLLIEANSAMGAVTMEVIDIKKGPLNAADFSIPSGYTQEKFFGK